MTPSHLKTAISRFRAAAYAFGATRRNAAATPSPLRKLDMLHHARPRPVPAQGARHAMAAARKS